MKKLHIYSQEFPHDEPIIMGDLEALTDLYNQLGKFIFNPGCKQSSELYYTADGEGFVLSIIPFHPNTQYPYTDPIYQSDNSIKHPIELLDYKLIKKVIDEYKE